MWMTMRLIGYTLTQLAAIIAWLRIDEGFFLRRIGADSISRPVFCPGTGFINERL